jgi:hypothetical protein
LSHSTSYKFSQSHSSISFVFSMYSNYW